jgi:hypothetical protein
VTRIRLRQPIASPDPSRTKSTGAGAPATGALPDGPDEVRHDPPLRRMSVRGRWTVDRHGDHLSQRVQLREFGGRLEPSDRRTDRRLCRTLITSCDEAQTRGMRRIPHWRTGCQPAPFGLGVACTDPNWQMPGGVQSRHESNSALGARGDPRRRGHHYARPGTMDPRDRPDPRESPGRAWRRICLPEWATRKIESVQPTIAAASTLPPPPPLAGSHGCLATLSPQ